MRRLLGLSAATFLAAASVALAASDKPCQDAHLALVIGNTAYGDDEAPLKGPQEGTRRVADALRDLGYETVAEENLSKARMQAAFDALLTSVKPRSIVFLYFSGYGVQSDRHTFLLPVDATVWSEADIQPAGIALERWLVELAEKGARAEVVAIDAARRNPFERRFRPSGSAGLAPITGINNVVAILSAAPDRVPDPSDVDVFAEHLAREIGASEATAQAAFGATQADVVQQSHGAQKPWTTFTFAEDLPLNGHDCAPPSREAEVAPPALHAQRTAAPQQPEPPQRAERKPKIEPEAAKPRAGTVAAPPSPEAPPLRAFETKLKDPELLDELNERLFEQALDPSSPGTGKTEEAIRAYEKRAGLPTVGYPTEGTLRSLREAASLKPWGAIAFSAKFGQWGMTWASPTRRQALAVAKSRCASNSCEQAVSFFGRRCGAFALSPKGWSMTWRVGGEVSRKAALDECGKHGETCRIVGAVCADGSDKSKEALHKEGAR